MPWFNFPFIARFSRLKQALSFVQWQNIPKSSLKYVLPGIPLVGFAGTWAYVRYQQSQFKSVIDKINAFHDATIAELEGSSALQLQDKLYLMGEVRFGDLQKHQDTRYKITEYNKVANQLREELSQFNWLARIESAPGINSFLNSSLPVGSSIDNAHLVLNLSATALALTDCFNWTVYHLKRRLYDAADRANAKALKMLEQNPLTQNCFKELSQAALFARAYNLAAKIARAQDKLAQSDQYYERAKSCVPNDPVIIGSQIALWGDMAWAKDSPALKKVEELINNAAEYKQLQKILQGYGLGLANLSWVLIQAVWNQEKLALPEGARQWCLQEAFKLADEAVPLLEQQPKSKSSVNARLFRGIIYMEQAKQLQQPEQYRRALDDFNAGLKADPDHPSLLRRRALVLRELGDPEAYAALQQARIELHYRLAHGEGSGRYQQWLNEIESQFLPGTPIPAAYGPYQQIIKHLTNNEYQAAYRLLQQLPDANERSVNIRAWIKRHFKVHHDQLIPKTYENDLLRFNLYQNPTPYEFMALSVATYAAKHGHPLGLPAGWEELCRSSQTHPASLQSGYLAVAYRHITTGQIIIGHGGTDWTDPADLITDIKLAFGKNYTQLSDAKQFTEQVLQLAEPEETQLRTIYHTGHSLGGMIAGYMACTLAPIGHHYAVTFDSPSSWRHLDQAYYDQLLKGLLPKQYADFPITAYLTRPSFINCAGGQHLGRALRIQIQLNPVQGIPDLLFQRGRQWLVDYIKQQKQLPADVADQWIKIVTANLACHDKDRIQAAFSNQDIKEIYSESKSTYYVTSWPQDVGQWLEFENLAASLNLNPLTYIPHENAETRLKALYALTPIRQGVGVAESYEVIPLSSLESGLQALLKNLLTQQPLTELQEHLQPYIHPDILAGLTWDEEKQVIQIKLPLAGWDLLTYFRQQVQEACYQEELAMGSVLYPILERLPRRGFSASVFYQNNNDSASNNKRVPEEREQSLVIGR